jgi:hypothetical protein
MCFSLWTVEGEIVYNRLFQNDFELDLLDSILNKDFWIFSAVDFDRR